MQTILVTSLPVTFEKQVAVRMPTELLARVVTYRERVRAATGVEITHAQAIRALLTKALDAEGVSLPAGPAKSPRRRK
jgi:hypothetical protein